ncbi:MAG: SOH1-domain-containing protein [Monoraphidium minutum]|nr:MAG: SOH1-domain-containing protein [Monoraphidium minutum]
MDVDPSPVPSTSGGGARSAAEATGIDDRTRFVVELEFLQCLANPFYLNWLAQNRYLEDPAFLHYLKYLDYWRQPAYAKYIKFPHCLLLLDLLLTEQFRKSIAVAQVADDIHTQQFYHWQHYRANRLREGTASVEGPAPADGGPGAAAQQQEQQQAAAAGGGS